MKYTYYLDNGVTDSFITTKLTRNNYKLFVKDIKNLNSPYNFSVYLGGSYLGYLSGINDEYKDVDFFIMGENLIDLNDLTSFMSTFHVLAKSYKIPYDLTYYMDINSDDLNHDNKALIPINQIKSKTIRLYSKKISFDVNSTTNYVKIPNTALFQGEQSIEFLSRKHIDKIQNKSIFQKLVKIT